MKIFKFFDYLESRLKWRKSPPVDNRTLEMCIFADLGEKYAKMWNAQIWHFSHRSADMKIFKFFYFLESLLKMMKTTTSWPQDPWNVHICWFGWEICKNAKCPKMTFFSQVHGHENLQIFRLSGKPLKNDENHHQLTTGPLKCAYLLIWVRKMQKCEMPKNDIFLAGPRSWKSSNFSTFWKAF